MMDKAEEQTKVGQLQGYANDLADSASKIHDSAKLLPDIFVADVADDMIEMLVNHTQKIEQIVDGLSGPINSLYSIIEQVYKEEHPAPAPVDDNEDEGENGEGNTDGDSGNAESGGSLTVLPKSWGSSITYNP